MDWEEKTAIKRSEGTFFQGLYRVKKQLPNAKTSAAINTEVLKHKTVDCSRAKYCWLSSLNLHLQHISCQQTIPA